MGNDGYIPPFTVNARIINYVADINELVTKLSLSNRLNDNLKLRRLNRLRSITSSLAIENNTLSLEQITDIINGKTVIGPQKDIQEAKNAFDAYEQLPYYDRYSIADLLKAHGIMMHLVNDDAGHFRKKRCRSLLIKRTRSYGSACGQCSVSDQRSS